MTGTTTGQTPLATATDNDDTENYLTVSLVAVLQALANLFESGTGHDHAGSGKGKPIGSAGIASSIILTSPHFASGATLDSGHLIAAGSAPTAAAGAQAGGSPPAPVVQSGSNDVRGLITFGTGTAPAAGAQVNVTFNLAFSSSPYVVVVPYNSNSQALGAFVVDNVTTTGFTLRCATAPAASQANSTYAFMYIVIG